MPAANKAQPWKPHWPPAQTNKAVASHGCPQGAKLYENGDTVSKPRHLTGSSSTVNSKAPPNDNDPESLTAEQDGRKD